MKTCEGMCMQVCECQCAVYNVRKCFWKFEAIVDNFALKTKMADSSWSSPIYISQNLRLSESFVSIKLGQYHRSYKTAAKINVGLYI